MAASLLQHLARGRFCFLRPDPEEIRRIVPDATPKLPEPQHIFLEDESATPLVGFPILLSPQLGPLQDALDQVIEIEEYAHYAYHSRETFDSRVYASRWDRYRGLLAQVTENATVSSYGHNYPGIFWLFHSQQIARRLKEVPRRIVRRDLQIGRDHGDSIKYRVFFKIIDRVVTLTQDIAHRLAGEIDEEEETLFPALLGMMRDNVLIFTEDLISPDLSELGSYFQGHLQIDGRDLRRRLSAIEAWHGRAIESDPLLRAAVANLLGIDPAAFTDGGSPLFQAGYLTFLSKHPSYSVERFLPSDRVQVWESLLLKLKEFEILHALRRMVVPLERENDDLISRDRSNNTTWVGGPPVLHVSRSTRPFDFMAPWVVDPVVHRYGLVYDISDFSATLTLLGRAEASALDQAFRMMFRFQRRINKLAASQLLKLEKYLGDGAFFSGRAPRQMLVVAVHLQRIYSEALERGFPFDRGLRVAINYGQYRLLPLESAAEGQQSRYEFFGHGLVELSRMATGKAGQEIDEVKTFLVAQGYPETTVNTFFAPMLRRRGDLVSKREEERRFFAYINANQTLVNEGIVATEAFVARLGTFDELYFAREDRRGYIVMTIEDETVGEVRLAVRKLGLGKFKGLGQVPVYEVVDAGSWDPATFTAIPPQTLIGALKRLFASTVTARQKAATEARAARASETP